MAQLAEIANYVYNTSGIGSYEEVSDLTLDYNKVTKLGFSAISGSSVFYVWAGGGQNYSNTSATVRYFAPTYTRYYLSNRNSGFMQAICLAD